MAGGGVIYLNFAAVQHKLSSIPCRNSEKDDGVQCSIPYGRGGNRFAKLIETNILEQISMLEHILRLFSIEIK